MPDWLAAIACCLVGFLAGYQWGYVARMRRIRKRLHQSCLPFQLDALGEGRETFKESDDATP